MTNSEQAIREFAEKWCLRVIECMKDDDYIMHDPEGILSDLTALISEHYVSKMAYDTIKERHQALLIAAANDIEKDYIDKYYYPKEKYDELLQQRDELREALKWVKESITRWCFLGKADAMLKIEAAIKNTEKQ